MRVLCRFGHSHSTQALADACPHDGIPDDGLKARAGRPRCGCRVPCRTFDEHACKVAQAVGLHRFDCVHCAAVDDATLAAEGPPDVGGPKVRARLPSDEVRADGMKGRRR